MSVLDFTCNYKRINRCAVRRGCVIPRALGVGFFSTLTRHKIRVYGCFKSVIILECRQRIRYGSAGDQSYHSMLTISRMTIWQTFGRVRG